MTPYVIILGAGAPPEHNQPFGLQRVTLDRRVLDWQLDAFAPLNADIHFIGGYDIELVQQHFPKLTYHHNTRWRETGAVASLALALRELADIGKRDLYIIYSDILVRPALVQSLADTGDAAYAIASDTPDLHAKRTPEKIGDKEFVGLVRVPAALAAAFSKQAQQMDAAAPRAQLSALVADLQKNGAPVHLIDAHDVWAHAEFGRSVAHFILGSKATTLERLRTRLQASRILPLVYFTRAQYVANADNVIEALCSRFGGEQHVVVRSSATDEDGFTRANAGRYHSELNIRPEQQTLAASIGRVFDSYGGIDPNDEVLVQPQLRDVVMSGVIFTRTLENAAPYYVVNYTRGADTTAVTAGKSGEQVKTYIARCATQAHLAALPAAIHKLLEAVKEIEHCVCHDALDIEFAIDSAGAITTLQVRPLMIGDTHQDRGTDDAVEQNLTQVMAQLRTLQQSPSSHVGGKALWSVMADWNPAEIIGRTPAPLARDLYRHIITDHTWAQQRHEVGYRDLRNWPLMRDFAGQAFIDVRASLNSFIPAPLDDALATTLVDEALRQLEQHPHWHDKIEFELLPTCIDFTFERWQARYETLCDAQSLNQWRDGLRNVTTCIIARTEAAIAAAQALEARCPSLELRSEPFGSWLSTVLTNCSEGALTFAHLARAGFVAAAFLRSAVAKGYLREERRVELMESIDGVGRMFTDAAASVRNGKLERSAFIARFGHLRPGTYDITTPAYRAAPERYLDPVIASAAPSSADMFTWDEAETTQLNKALAALAIGIDAQGLLNFIRQAVTGREYSKFVFTRLLSAALDALQIKAEEYSIEADMRHAMPLHSWLAASAPDVKALQQETHMRYHAHRVSTGIVLPPLLRHENELFVFDSPASEPTFITARSARSQLRILRSGEVAEPAAVEGHIVAILNADPGFDYLFALGIAGLITAYGGPNSHMAIRSCEYGIPALIGIGEDMFNALREGNIVSIDGQQRRWTVEDASCV